VRLFSVSLGDATTTLVAVASARANVTSDTARRSRTRVLSIVEFAGVHHEVPRLSAIPDEIDFVSRNFGASRRRRLQQRYELWLGPFACAEFGKLTPRHARRVNLERSAKRSTRGNDPEIASKEQQRFVRGGDHSKSAGCFYVGRSEGAHGLGPGAEDSRSESRNSAEAGSRPPWAAIRGVGYHFNGRTPNTIVLT
jgi:hypothetical protein